MTQLARSRTADPMLLAVLANRFEAIVPGDDQHAAALGRSSIINMARDFSCSIGHRRQRAARVGRGSAGARDRHRVPRRGDARAAHRPAPRATPSCTTIRTSATTHAGRPRDPRPGVLRGRARVHRRGQGSPGRLRQRRCRRPTCPTPGRLRGGRADLPLRARPARLRDIEDIIRMCRRRIRVPEQWYGDYLAALGAARIGERRLKELCAQYGVETVQRVHRGVVRLLRAPHGARRSGSCPPASWPGCATHDPYPGLPDGVPLTVTVAIDPDEGPHRARPSRQPRQLSRAASTSRGRARRTTR